MSDTVLITGATGFMGRALTAALRNEGEEVRALSPEDGDIADAPLRTADDVGHVYHLAALTFVPDSWTRAHAYYRTDVLGTATVLEYCRRTGASSTARSVRGSATDQRDTGGGRGAST